MRSNGPRKDKPPRLGIPLERMVAEKRATRGMPFVWAGFAILLAASIIIGIRMFYAPSEGETPAPKPPPSLAGATAPPSPPIAPSPPAADNAPATQAAPAEIPADTGSAPFSGNLTFALDSTQNATANGASLIRPSPDRTVAILREPAQLELRSANNPRETRVTVPAGQQVEIISNEGAGRVRIRHGTAEGLVSNDALSQPGITPTPGGAPANQPPR